MGGGVFRSFTSELSTAPKRTLLSRPKRSALRMEQSEWAKRSAPTQDLHSANLFNVRLPQQPRLRHVILFHAYAGESGKRCSRKCREAFNLFESNSPPLGALAGEASGLRCEVNTLQLAAGCFIFNFCCTVNMALSVSYTATRKRILTALSDLQFILPSFVCRAETINPAVAS